MSNMRQSEGTKKWRQMQVLQALDLAQTQYCHFSTIVIAGMGFFTDSYDLFCIGTVTRLLGRIYYTDGTGTVPGTLPISVNAAVTGTALCGIVAGQIFFGWLGDRLGRKKGYGITLLLMITFSIASGLSFSRTASSVMATLCFFRFWLGFGIGGDYPLSATIMSEYANTTTRGAFLAAVFAMQGLGILTGGAVGMTLALIFNSVYPAPPYTSLEGEVQINSTVPQADYLWRIMFMLGAIPAAATFYYRMRMPETARYTVLIKRDAKRAAEDMTKFLKVPISELTPRTAVSTNGDSKSDDNGRTDKMDENVNAAGRRLDENNFGLFSREFLRKHGLPLLGTASTWFLLDIAYYSQNLYQNQIFDAIGWTPPPQTMNAVYEMYTISKAQFLLALFGTVPGYWMTVLLVDRIGRKAIQLQGFFFMSVFLFAVAIRFQSRGDEENIKIFLALYACFFFFANFGPNATTFIIPAEMFPARLRATCHGISAASGKVGAIIGTFGFLYASQPTQKDDPHGIGIKHTFLILASTCICGILFTFLIPETKNRSLEDLSGERPDFSDEFSEHPKLRSVL